MLGSNEDSPQPSRGTAHVKETETMREMVDGLVFQTYLDSQALALQTTGAIPPGIPQKLGKYRLLRYIGGGGFGLVFEAIDELLERSVAIKLPRPDIAARNLTERFLDEARVVANLQHPSILSPLDAGVVDQQPFIVYPLCPGPNLAQWLTAHSSSLSPTLAARIIRDLCSAVAFSHQNNVLHRDIKPANVLLFPHLQPEGDFAFNVKLTDFGIAKVIPLDTGATASSVLLGTPLYLSPEQINGQTTIGEATDIYALGVLLYELLTKERPFASENMFELMRKIREDEAIPITRTRKDIPRDIEKICMKCLQKDASDRYPTAQAMIDDLDRFVSGQSVRASGTSRIRRLWRWCDHPERYTDLGKLSIVAAIGLIIWSIAGIVVLRLLGESNIGVGEAALNTFALSTTVAAPLMIAGIGTMRRSRWGMRLGIASTLLGVAVSLIAFTPYQFVYPEVYARNPVARTIAFSFLLMLFGGLFSMYAFVLRLNRYSPKQ